MLMLLVYEGYPGVQPISLLPCILFISSIILSFLFSDSGISSELIILDTLCFEKQMLVV